MLYKSQMYCIAGGSNNSTRLSTTRVVSYYVTHPNIFSLRTPSYINYNLWVPVINGKGTSQNTTKPAYLLYPPKVVKLEFAPTTVLLTVDHHFRGFCAFVKIAFLRSLNARSVSTSLYCHCIIVKLRQDCYFIFSSSNLLIFFCMIIFTFTS